MNKSSNLFQRQWLSSNANSAIVDLCFMFSILLIVVSTPVSAGLSDEVCRQRFSPIIESLDVAAMAMTFNDPATDEVCSPALRHEIHLNFTNEVANRAGQILQDDNGPRRASEWLDQFSAVELGLPLAKSWQVNYVRGEIAMVRGDKREAAEQLEIAYERSLGSSTHISQPVRPATTQQQQYLYLRANEARHLYGDLSGAISRSGEPAAATFGTRGIVQQPASPAPIQFKTESAVIEPEGMKNVSLIVAYIRRQNYKEFEIIGHTDWRGDTDYNQNLSVKRAEAVAEAIQNQYRGSNAGTLLISIRGRGEECARIVSQIDQYSIEEAAALYRRVSFAWPHQGVATLSECDSHGIKTEEEARNRLSKN